MRSKGKRRKREEKAKKANEEREREVDFEMQPGIYQPRQFTITTKRVT
jgi:hypothetical protein